MDASSAEITQRRAELKAEEERARQREAELARTEQERHDVLLAQLTAKQLELEVSIDTYIYIYMLVFNNTIYSICMYVYLYDCVRVYMYIHIFIGTGTAGLRESERETERDSQGGRGEKADVIGGEKRERQGYQTGRIRARETTGHTCILLLGFSRVITHLNHHQNS